MWDKKDLQIYKNALNELSIIENKLVDGGLIFEDEALSLYNIDFVRGRIKRLDYLIAAHSSNGQEASPSNS